MQKVTSPQSNGSQRGTAFAAMANILVNYHLWGVCKTEKMRAVREREGEGERERERKDCLGVKRSLRTSEMKNHTGRMTSGLVWALDRFPDGLRLVH